MHVTTKTVLFALLICIVTAEARSKSHTSDGSEIDEQVNESEQPLRSQEERSHRRKRQYGHYFQRRYQAPQDDLYQELLEQRLTQRDILRKLDEILIYVMRPPPPPPPVRYVYVRYPVPSRCNCTKKPSLPSVPSRFPEMEDVNMNWGLVDYEYEDEANNRPLSFDTLEKPTESPIRPNNNPRKESDAAEKNRCYAAVLQCCIQPARRQSSCLVDKGCQSLVCSKQSTKAAVDFYSTSYAPST